MDPSQIRAYDVFYGFNPLNPNQQVPLLGLTNQQQQPISCPACNCPACPAVPAQVVSEAKWGVWLAGGALVVGLLSLALLYDRPRGAKRGRPRREISDDYSF